MSTIRTAADTIRARLGELQDDHRGPWDVSTSSVYMCGCTDGTIRVPGRPYALRGRFRPGVPGYLATVASPDVATALADLLDALAWWRQAITSGDDMDVAAAVNRVHATGDSLADAITRGDLR